MWLPFIVCLSILVLTQIADYWSSKKALQNTSAQEANWVVRKIGLIPAKLGGIALFTWITYVLSFVNPSVVLLITITVAVTAFYTWVVLHNLKIAEKR